jgi:hypothetical protein
MECRRSAALTRPVIGPKLKISARPHAPVACHLSLGCQAVMHAAACVQVHCRHSLDDSAATCDTQIYFLEATRPHAPVACSPVISLIPTCHCHGRAQRCVYTPVNQEI